MADYLDAFSALYDNVRLCVKATWPELQSIGMIGRLPPGNTKPGGVWDALHIDTVPYKELRPPYAIIDINKMGNASGTYGSDLRTWRVPVSVLYVDDYEGAQAPTLPKLLDLSVALDQYDSTKLHMEDLLDIDVSPDLPVNAILSRSGRQVRAGRLTFNAIIAWPFRVGMTETE